MKRVLFLILTMFVLCGCTAPTQKNSLANTIEAENNIFTESNTPTETEDLDISDTTAPVSSDAEVQVIDGEGMVPLLFIKTDIYNDRAYVLAAGKDGNVYRAEQFEYDGEPLYGDHSNRMTLTDEPATTKILETDRELRFINTVGEEFSCFHEGVTTTGEMALGHIFVHAHLPQSLTLADGAYLGSYADVDMFPQDAQYTKNGIVTDLDKNGAPDQITWEYTENTPVESHPSGYSGYLYDFKISIERNGIVYTIENEKDDIVIQEGIQVFVGDVDQDGEYELIVFENTITNSCYCTIYGWDETGYSIQQYCTVAPLP